LDETQESGNIKSDKNIKSVYKIIFSTKIQVLPKFDLILVDVALSKNDLRIPV